MPSHHPPAAAANPSSDLEIELWGGHECTVNRVGDRWFDQTPLSGHEHRVSDLELVAGLGMRSVRYPALWERIAPRHPHACDFAWTDGRMAEFQRLGLQPILTLCHHGSGPHYTSLLHDTFAAGLARHAGLVARRYPWVRDWTPVNEPLTTARFSALYGFWYPHLADEGAFWRVLLNEIDATRLSMRAIRAVNPAARLIQTDDLGFVHATPPLQAEADHVNERRWMTWDLLCGHVVPGHALWDRLVAFGLEERLRQIADDPCPPDVVGVNHYLSSERLFDHRLERYEHRSLADRRVWDADGTPHVDVDAIRHLRTGVLGPAALLAQAWARYGLPIAVTECHNGTSREEQVRWFVEVWDTARQLRREGVDIRAVTAWSLLGSYDWNRMVTRSAGHYEPGVFDVRSGQPRPTLLAHVLRDLASGRTPVAPGLHVPGWWRRESRFRDTPPSNDRLFQLPADRSDPQAAAALLIVSDDGPLAQVVARACESRGLHYVLAGEQEAVAVLRRLQPWALLDAVDRDRLCPSWANETLPPAGRGGRDQLVQAGEQLGVPCAAFARFDGAARAQAQTGALLLACTGPVYTPWDRAAPAVAMLDALDRAQPLDAASAPWDLVYGPDLVDGVLDLLLDGVRGPVSFLPRESWTEAEFASVLAAVADRDPTLVAGAGSRDADGAELAAWRASSHLPLAETTLERFVREARQARPAGLPVVDCGHEAPDRGRLAA
ncbi:MAG TPA: family 1 glycosylhydrolase [Ramlibacter sp.]|jgi:dTDP-4-dehydrorhamnose reductase|uniref:family 1 glycosylhydrolase n=1 Tax=Ramlibacter sp. TaxID=1917967 RepID=UPI002D29AE29|nr:family 1 glycosylhydrolase [Ramlibacter sp.]HZY17438.1 family 1 glycosylhydrolase [Ramlibacter sp.]